MRLRHIGVTLILLFTCAVPVFSQPVGSPETPTEEAVSPSPPEQQEQEPPALPRRGWMVTTAPLFWVWGNVRVGYFVTNRLELHAGIRSFDAYTDGAYISRNYVGVANYIKPEGDTWFFELDYEDYQAYAPKGNLVVLDKSKFASLGMGYQWFWENGFTMGVGLGYPHLVNIPLGWSF